MAMMLPKDLPMLQSITTKNWTRVNNVFATGNMQGHVVVCDMDPRLRGLGTDHVPVLMTLDFKVPARSEEAHRNFRATDWDRFREDLAEWLCYILGLCTLLTDSQFQRAVAELMQTIQAMIESVVPMPWPSPLLCHWWSYNLS